MQTLTKDILISNEIKYMIEAGKFKPDEKLPSERDLADIMKVQRTTIRSALSILLSEGVIYKKDRSGSYVSKKRLSRNVYSLVSVEEAKTCNISLKIEYLKSIELNKILAQKVHFPIGTECYKIGIVKYADEESVSVEISYIPKVNIDIKIIEPLVNQKSFNKSIYSKIEKKYKLKIHTSEMNITACKADAAISKYLDIKTNSYVVLQDGLLWSNKKEPFAYIKSYMKENRFEFVEKN